MSLKEQLTDDMKAAMRAKESARLATVRLIIAEVKRKEVDEQTELNDEQVVAEIEKGELAILSAYMPAGLSDEEVAAEVAAAVAATGAAGPQDMGKVMGVLKPKLAGRADMTVVSGLVKKALTGA